MHPKILHRQLESALPVVDVAVFDRGSRRGLRGHSHRACSVSTDSRLTFCLLPLTSAAAASVALPGSLGMGKD